MSRFRYTILGRPVDPSHKSADDNVRMDAVLDLLARFDAATFPRTSDMQRDTFFSYENLKTGLRFDDAQLRGALEIANAFIEADPPYGHHTMKLTLTPNGEIDDESHVRQLAARSYRLTVRGMEFVETWRAIGRTSGRYDP